MATRNGQQLDLVWLRVDLSGIAVASIDSLVGQRLHSNRLLANVEPSFNTKIDGTEAIVKVNGDQSWIQSLPLLIQNKIIQHFVENEHSDIIALVTSVAWRGEAQE